MPAHLVAQQLLALTLQEADEGLPLGGLDVVAGRPTRLGRRRRWAGPTRWSPTCSPRTGCIDDGGVLGPGHEAEKTIGQRNFLELMSVFVSDPLVSIRQGRIEIGQVPDLAITAALGMKPGPPRLLLAGRSWKINDIDWKRRVAQVEPADEKASVRFSGLAQPLSYELCQAVAEVLGGAALDPVTVSTRAAAASSASSATRDAPGRKRAGPCSSGTQMGLRWYTFAGLRANLELAARLDTLRSQITQRDNLSITLDPDVNRESLDAARSSPTPSLALAHLVEDVAGALKLQNALPETLVRDIMVERLTDPDSVTKTALAPVDYLERGRATWGQR